MGILTAGTKQAVGLSGQNILVHGLHGLGTKQEFFPIVYSGNKAAERMPDAQEVATELFMGYTTKLAHSRDPEAGVSI